MAKYDYCTDVGMWYVNTRSTSTNPDQRLNAIVPEFRLIWDGHATPPPRACNVVHTSQGGINWGYTQAHDPGLNTEEEQEAYGFGEWILRVKETNETSPGNPRYLKSIVFRGMWNLLRGTGWSTTKIRNMVKYFLDYFYGVGNPKPQHTINGQSVQLTCSELNLVRGYFLSDDFTKYSYGSDWDYLVQQVHAEQQAHSQLNLPFYFTNQVFGPGLWDNLPTSGHRLDKLKQWLGVFNSTGAIPVFVPQWYPWVYKANNPAGKKTDWSSHDDRGPWIWWDIALDELLNLKNTYCCTLRVQPIIQASAWAEPSGSSVGPGHIDMHNQLRAVLNHPVVSGVWLIGWNPPLAGGSYQVSWAAYNGGEDHWTDRQHLAEAVQVEAGGSSEVVITAPTSGGITAISNSPIIPGEKQIERTRISFSNPSRQNLQIHIHQSGSDTRTQMNAYQWSSDSYSFNGPWMYGVYDQNPDPNAGGTRDPLHGTSVNWNGWRENDSAQAGDGTYTVKLQDGNGNQVGNLTKTVDVDH